MGAESPACKHLERNAALILSLSGMPKLTLLTPSTVQTPKSSVTCLTARAVSSACVSSVAMVSTKQSMMISLFLMPRAVSSLTRRLA